MKQCTKCLQIKPISEFWADRSKKHGYSARCKTCKKEALRKYYKNHPEINKKRYWENRNTERERHLKRKYGITFKDYYLMLNNQNGNCAICGKPEPKHKMFDVDHDHKTGEVRGLLCTSCNRMLGHSGDNPETLKAAVNYLIKAYMEIQ